MILELKVNQVMSLGNGMVRLLLVRRGLKTRIEPINQTEEARDLDSQIVQDMIGKVARTARFDVTGQSFSLYGVCRECDVRKKMQGVHDNS